MNYYRNWFAVSLPLRSSVDLFKRAYGYQHKHGPDGRMWPKKLRKKPRNR